MNRSPATVATFLMCILAILGCNDSASNTSTAHDQEPIARGVAEDFLISSGPARGYSDLNSKAGPYATKHFNKNVMSNRVVYGFNGWSITSQSMNASRTEAIVRGSLQVTHKMISDSTTVGADEDRVGFRIVLINEQGQWLVDTIEFGAAQSEEKAPADGKGSQ